MNNVLIGWAIALLVIVVLNGIDWRTIALLVAIALVILIVGARLSAAIDIPVWLSRTIGGATLVLTAISVLCLWAFPNIAFPEPTGAHKVGTSSHAAGETKFRMWYPAMPTPETQRYRYLSDVTSGTGVIPSFIYTHLKSRPTAAFETPPLNRTDMPYPVIFYMHGADSFAEDNSFLLMELASHGYVVVAISPQKPFADYQIDPSLAYEPALFVDTLATKVAPDQIADMKAVVAEVFAMNANQNAIVATGLRESQFGVLGYSLGGGVASRFCATDQRCAAIVNLDGNAFGAIGKTGVSAPYFHFSQSALFPSSDGVKLPEVTQRTAEHYQAEVSEFISHTARQAPAYWYTLKGSGHASFTDMLMWTPLRFAMFNMLLGDGEKDTLRETIADISVRFFNEFLYDVGGLEQELVAHAEHLEPRPVSF